MLRRLPFSAALAALAVPLALAGPAHADPGGAPAADPATQTQQRKAQPADGSGSGSRKEDVSRRAERARARDQAPLSVSIDQLSPSTIPDRGMVRVSGFVTNNDVETWSTINVYAFVSDTPMTTPEQLAAAAKLPPDAVVGGRIANERHKGFIAELAPGDSAPYSISIPRHLLHISTPGVYWFGVHALGESAAGRDQTADGRARTFLPLVPDARPGEQPTAIVIPLRHALVYTADGSLDDLAGWIRALSPGGRLRSLVDFGASSGSHTVSWAIDPALVDAVRRIADGNPPRSLEPNLEAGQVQGDDEGDEGDTTESPGPTTSPAATEGGSATESPSGQPSEGSSNPLDLDQLDPVVQAAAKAAETWLARLGAAMRPEDQVLSLPYGDVDAAAAALHDPQFYTRAVARAGTTLPGFDVTTTPVLSSPSGYLNAQGIAAADPSSTILLTDQMFDAPAPALARIEGHDAVVTSTGAASGGPGPDDPTALTAMRQRLLSEAAVRFLRGDHAPLTMVLPHDWAPPADGATFFGGLDPAWLDITSVDAVSRSAAPTTVDPATLRYPRYQQEAELDQPNFDSADALITSGVSLQNLLTLNNLVSGTVTDQALGSASYSARTRPILNRASTDQSRVWIESRLGSVHVSAPRAVTLSSSSGRFQAVITNNLDQPVTVSLDATADRKLTIDGPRRVAVPASSRQAVLLTAHTNENGIHEVTLAVADKRGTPLGASTALTIRSAQVSNVIWLFIVGGMGLFFGAIGVRLFRRVRSSRRRQTESGDAGDEPAASEQKEPAGAGSR
ncbi:MAG TPA: DUF6049 family protein [Nocardioides sp.]|uniref:DUF6049 family protein n=1 Tax=Nocardioides sp. TaxID=35761 RepID=UPI002E320644|nr:DUF6049 family protein [Nocardioides sp.]HEX5090660.1 DUF6049 family protein [Nocardioides sp.]